MPDKMEFTAEVVSMANTQWLIALVSRLTEKGVLTIDEANEVSATAVSQCKAAGNPAAASLIEAINPTCKGIDPVEAARKRGVEIQQAN